jgi:hypothetical protein
VVLGVAGGAALTYYALDSTVDLSVMQTSLSTMVKNIKTNQAPVPRTQPSPLPPSLAAANLQAVQADAAAANPPSVFDNNEN